MGMNKKAQTFMVGLMIAFMGVIAVIGAFPALKDIVVDVRSPANLDCTNTSITDGIKAVCVVVDYSAFAWGGVAIGVAVSMIGIFAMLSSKKK